MGVEVETKDTGATGLYGRLEDLGQSFTFGVHDDAAPYPDGSSTVERAATFEFGGRNMPRRSFLRGYVDGGGKKDIAAAAAEQIGEVVDGDAPDTVSEVAGAVAVEGVLDYMSKGIRGVAGPDYVGKAGGTVRDLNETGHLRSQITSKPGES